VTEHDRLPLPDYDHLPLGSVQTRIRSLDADGVTALLEYEREHGNRLPVVQILEERLRQLDDGAEPTGGSASAWTPEADPVPPEGSTVSPQTSGPPVNPPTGGDPTNPAQPRR
jgi:hypothetical protein